jgi:hypothetical protein
MVTIPIKTRLKADGTLDLRVPTGLPESEVEVLVILQPVVEPTGFWPEGFFDSTFGAFADYCLERGDRTKKEFVRRRALGLRGASNAEGERLRRDIKAMRGSCR